MKKIFIILTIGVISFFIIEDAQAQAESQINFGLIGASLEFPVSEDVTIAPFGATNFSISYLVAGVKANYYFDHLLGIPSEFDFYGGINGGFAIGFGDTADDFDIALHLGFRWFWNDRMGVYLEGSGGRLEPNGGIGLTVRL